MGDADRRNAALLPHFSTTIFILDSITPVLVLFVLCVYFFYFCLARTPATLPVLARCG
jgi:hypothetical protein